MNLRFAAGHLAACVSGAALLAACGLGRPPSPAVDAGAAPVLDDGGDAGVSAPVTATPLPSADELTRLAEETLRGGHASRVHDGRAPFAAALDLPDGGCGRVALVGDQPIIAVVEDSTGPRGEAVDAGARVLALVPSAGPVCGGVTLSVRGAGNVRWTTVTR